jgi:hypothetical protein
MDLEGFIFAADNSITGVKVASEMIRAARAQTVAGTQTGDNCLTKHLAAFVFSFG